MTTEEAWEQLRIARAMAKPYCFALVPPHVLQVLLEEHDEKAKGEPTDDEQR